MADKGKPKSVLSRVLIVGTIVILTPIVWGILGNIYHAIVRSSQNSELKAQIKEYQQSIERDSLIIEQIKSDEGLEKYARENYYMQRRGEKIYIIE